MSRQVLIFGVALLVGVWQVHRMTSAFEKRAGALGTGGGGGEDAWMGLSGPAAAASWSGARSVLSRFARDHGWAVAEVTTFPGGGGAARGGRDDSADENEPPDDGLLSQSHPLPPPLGRPVKVIQLLAGQMNANPTTTAPTPLLTLIPHNGPLPLHQQAFRRVMSDQSTAGARGRGGSEPAHGKHGGGGMLAAARKRLFGTFAGGSSADRRAPVGTGKGGNAPQQAHQGAQAQFDIVLPAVPVPSSAGGGAGAPAGGDSHTHGGWVDAYHCFLDHLVEVGTRGSGGTRRGVSAADRVESWQGIQQSSHGRGGRANRGTGAGVGTGGSAQALLRGRLAAPPANCSSSAWMAAIRDTVAWDTGMRRTVAALHGQGLVAQLLVWSPVTQNVHSAGVHDSGGGGGGVVGESDRRPRVVTPSAVIVDQTVASELAGDVPRPVVAAVAVEVDGSVDTGDVIDGEG